MKHIQGTSITGYVTVLAKGDKPELFFQMCLNNEVPVWNVKKLSDNECQGNIRLSDIRAIRKLKRNTNYHLKFQSRKGYPFIWKRFLRKKEVLIGIILSFLFIFFLSNVIWKVDIKGVPTDIEEKVIEQLNSYGIHSGSWILSLDEPTVIQQKLLQDIPELLWIGIERKGTTYSLEGVEKLIAEKEKEHGPRNLIARKKGVIKSVYVAKGIPKVHVHDYVDAGDVLVSGYMEEEEDEEEKEKKKKIETVASEAEIIAETWHESSVTVPMEGSYEMITGEKKNKYSLSAGNISVPIWGFSDPDYKHIHSETTEKPLYFFKWKLPFTVDKTVLSEKKQQPVSRDEEEAKNIGIEQAKKELQLSLGPEAEITSHKILHERTENGKVKLILYVTVEEDITKPQSIRQGD